MTTTTMNVTGMKFIQFHDYNYQLLSQLEETGHITDSGLTW